MTDEERRWISIRDVRGVAAAARRKSVETMGRVAAKD